ncbi:MAG: hypothetical protein ACTSO6_07495 [Promethearchaeota archaeon]
MKLVYKEFLCPLCGQIRWLKVKNICVDCRDKLFLDEMSQSRKEHLIMNEQICV